MRNKFKVGELVIFNVFWRDHNPHYIGIITQVYPANKKLYKVKWLHESLKNFGNVRWDVELIPLKRKVECCGK